MKKYSVWKWAVLATLVALSMLIVLPWSAFDQLRAKLGIRGGIRKGLDIAGGASFTLGIDLARIDTNAIAARILQDKPGLATNQLDAEVAAEIEALPRRALEIIRNRVDGMGIAEPSIFLQKGRDGTRIVIQLPGITKKQMKEAEEILKTAAYLEFRLVHEKSEKLSKTLLAEGFAPPGYSIITEDNMQYYVIDAMGTNRASKEQSEVFFRSMRTRLHPPPPDAEFLLEKVSRKNREFFLPLLVEKKIQLVGSGISKASWERDPTFGQYKVEIQFAGEAKKKFGIVTTKNVNRPLAIVLDGTLYSAPNINEPILGGQAVITGRFNREEAMKLATVLQTGALDAPVEFKEKRIVDPTLGADAVKNGVLAGVLGCTAIIVLMAAYYLIPGLLADFALILNLILIPLGMILVAGFLGVLTPEARAGAAIALPVLTLPGIAGIALTIGMAVDANVLIFERMREELRTGKGFNSIVQAGFDKAFSAIFDSNITTIITAVILFVLGSGAVRGYAVTLTGGLIVSLFTAVVVTRMCFNLISTRTESLSVFRMFSVIKPTNIDFMSLWKPALSCSLVIIIGSWALMTYHYKKDVSKVMGVDFTGGSSITVSYKKDKKPDVETLRKAFGAAGIDDASIQYQETDDKNNPFQLQIKVAKIVTDKNAGELAPLTSSTVKAGQTNEVAASTSNAVPVAANELASAETQPVKQDNVLMKILTRQFPDAGFDLLQEDTVGAQVSKDLGKNALNAMTLSLIAMIIYIALRFKFGFALGAVIALFHDVLITAGLTHLLGFQINMTVLAALMTIVGYSVNDTIVIFDRVREDLKLYRNKSFVDICNQAMNETLSRTLLTNFLTFVSVLFLLLLGGQALRDFSVAMFIGMIAGTYSTMYIATPVVLMWYRHKRPDLGTTAKIG